MRIAVYVRVSTPNQVQQQTIDHQLERLRQHCTAQGWVLAEEHIFRDDGYSGANLTRPGLDRLRDTVRARELDRVLVTAPDRLARNYVHQMVLLDEFERAGCPIEFLDRPMSHDPHDQLLLQIRGAVAEYERTLITERMRRGRLTKLQAGVLLPWIHAPYGYVPHPERPRDPASIQVDPAQAAVVTEIFALYLSDGATLRGISGQLHARQIPSPTGRPRWGVATLLGLLTNPVYTGRVYVGRWHYQPPQIRRSATHPLGRAHDSAIPTPPERWTLVATVPAIVSQEDFDRVQAKLPQNKARAWRNNTAHLYLLRALVSCGRCGRACVALTRGRYRYYWCSGKMHPIHSGQEEPCPARFIPAAQLDELIWQDVRTVLTEPGHLTAALGRAHGGQWMPHEWQARQENLRKAQASIEQQIERLTAAYLHEVIPLAEYQRRRRELEQKLGVLAEQQQQLARQATRQAELIGVAQGIAAFCARVQQGLDSATFAQQRQLVELLIDRVVVTDDEVEIRYVIPTSPSSEQVRFCHLRSDYFHAPNFVRPADRQGHDQVGIAAQGGLAIGRVHLAFSRLRSQAQVRHHAADLLAADWLPLALQQRRAAAVAVGRPLLRQALHRVAHLLLPGVQGLLIIEATAWVVEHLAHQADRIARFHQAHSYGSFLLSTEPSKLEAFFATSSSMVSRPIMRSSSAIRSCWAA
jgi:site-specific DNA recombinase